MQAFLHVLTSLGTPKLLQGILREHPAVGQDVLVQEHQLFWVCTQEM